MALKDSIQNCIEPAWRERPQARQDQPRPSVQNTENQHVPQIEVQEGQLGTFLKISWSIHAEDQQKEAEPKYQNQGLQPSSPEGCPSVHSRRSQKELQALLDRKNSNNKKML